MKVHETQEALLALFGFKPGDLITRLQLDVGPGDIPELTVQRYVDLDNTPGLNEVTQHFHLVAIDQPTPVAPLPFDIDAACTAALQRVQHWIDIETEELHTQTRHSFRRLREQRQTAFHFNRKTGRVDYAAGVQ